VEGMAPLKSYQRFPSLLEELDFWPGTMIQENGQPIERRVGSVKQEMVERREQKVQGGVTGGKQPDDWGQGPRGESVRMLFTRMCGIHFIKQDKRG